MTSKFFPNRPYLRGVLFMIASTASFSLMNIFIRMGAEEVHVTVQVFLRNFLTVIVLVPLALRHDFALLRTRRLKSHFWRATIGVVGMQAWFHCVSILPLNQATALSFTAPIFTTLVAVLLLKEKADIYRWMGIFASFLGVLIILHPGSSDFTWQSLLVLFATSMWALASVLVKALTRTESPLRIVFFMSLFMALWALPPALYHWQWPDLYHWIILLAMATAAFFAQWLLAMAYKETEVVKLMPFDFGRLIFTAIFAYFAFGEVSNLYTWAGATVILVSTFLAVRRDAKSSSTIVSG
ncbi:MAG: DMT family transporter [Alphaproteobacteria bacterium]